ncbi:branched-chain amino acid transport system permease protein [Pseudokineococcus lusitanus]|uniref:Branched-chain amino acid transport system permease protein n=1 Tax=Pseudokineococcus lusitanus TaxID=763993 RepID=A0A3N1HSQ1_9ACTN|nr:branched-chain amino acid transport system permease protein [Pseudokineococcus lusitanus]
MPPCRGETRLPSLAAVRGLLALVALTLLLGLAPALAGGATPAAAATPAPTATAGAEEGETITVRVRTGDREDVEGAEVTATGPDGTEVTGTTDDGGAVRLVVPAPGTYSVGIDPESLTGPAEGLLPQANPVERSVTSGSANPVVFQLTEEGAQEASGGGITAERVAQLLASGLRFGLIIALAAIGLSMIFGTTGLTNFAHGELITFGAISTYFLNAVAGLPFLVAAPLAVVLSGLFGFLNDRVVWRPLRRRGTGLVAMMIVSIGLALFLRYLYLYVFGGSTQTYADYQGQRGLDLGLFTLRPIDLFSMGLAVVVLVAVGLALVRTRLGKATRAVSDNPALASASGIDVDKVIRTVWVVGAALAGLAGVLLGLAQQVQYQMGFQVLLLVFAAVTLGGLGTAFGAMFGAIVVGIFLEVSTLVVPTELRNVGALLVLILILLVRPQGILGRASRIG